MTLGVELPRVEAGNSKRLEALTKIGPPPGLMFLNLDTGRMEQWVGDHWETIGQNIPGAPPYAPGPEGLGRARPAFVAYGATNGGGGGVTPSPRLPGDPPLEDPIAIKQLANTLLTCQDGAGTTDPCDDTEQTFFTATVPASLPAVTSRQEWYLSFFCIAPVPMLIGDHFNWRMKVNGTTIASSSGITLANSIAGGFSATIPGLSASAVGFVAGATVTVTFQMGAGESSTIQRTFAQWLMFVPELV